MAVEGLNEMQCVEHPYRSNNSGGGICAVCLQEKLGKLVSSSFPHPPLRPSSSSSSANASPSVPQSKSKSKSKSKKNASSSSSSSSSTADRVVFTRSKSTASARRGGNGRFWSFFTLHSSSSLAVSKKRRETVAAPGVSDDDDVASERKVSRSRSVGCGSRSFSGDFFERISTGFGDCTLRRVESQREGKTHSHARDDRGGVRERVRCGGIFGGFMLTSSSSSSSEWDVNGPKNVNLVHNRTRSWGWAFASPIRAFSTSKPNNNNNKTPNLAAIPSLLSARG